MVAVAEKRHAWSRHNTAKAAAEKFAFAVAVFERARLAVGTSGRPALDPAVRAAHEFMRLAKLDLFLALGELYGDCPQAACQLYRDAFGHVPAAEACTDFEPARVA